MKLMNGKKHDKDGKNDEKKLELSDFEKSLLEDAPEACNECGGTLKFERVNLEDFEGGKLYVIDEVPSFVCEECGEIWVPKPFLDEFEKMVDIIKKKKRLQKKNKE